MEIEVRAIRDYAASVRMRGDGPSIQASVIVARGINHNIINNDIEFPEITAVWDTIKAGVTFFDRVTRCCGCRLSERIASNLGDLEKLKDDFICLLVNLNNELSEEEFVTSTLTIETLRNTISRRMDAIRKSKFPESLDLIVDTCQAILSAMRAVGRDTRDRVRYTTDEVTAKARSIAKVMHAVDVLGELID